jgi:peptide-methionine (S)-S-oxide reductase
VGINIHLKMHIGKDDVECREVPLYIRYMSKISGSIIYAALLIASISAVSCVAEPVKEVVDLGPAEGRTAVASNERTVNMAGASVAVLGGGCFWCLEAVYELVPGVQDVESGYAGGSKENPSYEQVTTGLTGHAEVVRIQYDPSVVSYKSLLDLFWKIHDPTTKDRQGADVGSQYRSIILYTTPEQKVEALAAIAGIAGDFKNPVVTQLEPLGAYYRAETYHQDFYQKNPNYGYCQVVVAPKVDKARSFVDKLVPLKP